VGLSSANDGGCRRDAARSLGDTACTRRRRRFRRGKNLGRRSLFLRSLWNVGYGADSGRSRGDTCRPALRPFATIAGRSAFDRPRPLQTFKTGPVKGREAQESGLWPKTWVELWLQAVGRNRRLTPQGIYSNRRHCESGVTRGAQSVRLFRLDPSSCAVMPSRRNGMPAMVRTPVLPDAIIFGPLFALLRRSLSVE
jgi:hypothetical protein